MRSHSAFLTKAVRNGDGSVSSAAAFSYADAICECCSAVSTFAQKRVLRAGNFCSLLVACWAFPEKSCELVKQSPLDIVRLDSVFTGAPIECEAKTNYATTPQSLAEIFVVASVFCFLAVDLFWH
jgi:hypothetical protein